jgi:hypothetical protein
MKRYFIILFIALIMFNIGCAGSNKMRMPLVTIDRALVDPKGTWSVAPRVDKYINTTDSSAYRGMAIGYLLLPPISYAFTDNLQLTLSYLSYSALAWQLTKSPYSDTTMRNKWQFAMEAGINYRANTGLASILGLKWKKRLSPSVWYQGNLFGITLQDSGKYLLVTNFYTSNKIGFQLSPKACVMSGIDISYDVHNSYAMTHGIGCGGSFDFQYAFSPWFTLDVGYQISGYQRGRVEDMGLGVGGKFYW